MPAPNPTKFAELRKRLNDAEIAWEYRNQCTAIEFLSALLDSGGHGELNSQHGRKDLWVYRNKQDFEQRVEPTLVLWP